VKLARRRAGRAENEVIVIFASAYRPALTAMGQKVISFVESGGGRPAGIPNGLLIFARRRIFRKSAPVLPEVPKNEL
jgi:hypothetical protein